MHIRRVKENRAKKHSTRLVISQPMKLLSEVSITKRCTLSRRFLKSAGYFKHCKSLQDSFVDKETLQTPMTPTAMPSLRTTDLIEFDFDNGSLHPSSSLCLLVCSTTQLKKWSGPRSILEFFGFSKAGFRSFVPGFIELKVLLRSQMFVSLLLPPSSISKVLWIR